MEIPRMLLVMVHVLCLVVAGIGIAFSDLALFGRGRVDRRLLHTASRTVAWALSIMWASGLTIIWLDTGFDPALLSHNPKLMAKLYVVTLLTFNGWALHLCFFDMIIKARGRRGLRVRRAVNVSSLLAATSGATWFYAAFLGLAGPLKPVLSLGDFMLLYLLVLLAACLVVLRFLRPRIQRIWLQSFPSPSSLSRDRPARERRASARRHHGQPSNFCKNQQESS